MFIFINFIGSTLFGLYLASTQLSSVLGMVASVVSLDFSINLYIFIITLPILLFIFYNSITFNLKLSIYMNIILFLLIFFTLDFSFENLPLLIAKLFALNLALVLTLKAAKHSSLLKAKI